MDELINGRCKCGEPVVKTVDATGWTLRTDLTRYQYPGSTAGEYDIFRCRRCEEPIDDTWAATPPHKDG
jgi:hypothetical protein